MDSRVCFVERCFRRFEAAYVEQNLGIACDAFVEAINAHPDIGFRYFMVRASGQISGCLTFTRRAPEIVAILDRALADHSDMHVLVDYDPDLIRRMVGLRESNIAKGLPSIVIVTQGKSASVPVTSIFNSGYNLPSVAYSVSSVEVIESWARDYVRGGACYSTHLEPLPCNVDRFARAGVDKVIVHVRDPRQSLLSMIHHVSRYPDGRIDLARSGFAALNISQQISTLMDFYISRIRWIQGWMDAESRLNVMFSTFEDFVRDRDAFIERYVAFYGGPREHFSYENATRLHDGTDQHFRRGLVDEWRSVFPPRDAELLTACLPATMKQRFGWPD